MSKAKEEDLRKFSASNIQTAQTIPMRKTPPSAMQGVFESDLPSSTANEIDRLIFRDCKPMNEGSSEAEALRHDLKKLKEITGTIRGIVKQGAYLLGKNVHEAKEILHKHGKEDKTFSEWLGIAFAQSRKTAYNALNLYKFHEELPSRDLQARLKEIPQKAAYILASRDGDISRKVEILRNYADQKAEALITIIDETFPLPENYQRKRKDDDTTSVDNLYVILKKLQKRKAHLSQSTLMRFSGLKSLINDILESSELVSKN